MPALVRWALLNLGIALACAVTAFAALALAGAAGLRAAGEDPIDAGEYGFTLFLSAVWMWPLYLALLWWLGRRGRFRLRALLLSPVLVLGMSVFNLALQVPEVQATDLAGVLFALTVRPPPLKSER